MAAKECRILWEGMEISKIYCGDGYTPLNICKTIELHTLNGCASMLCGGLGDALPS